MSNKSKKLKPLTIGRYDIKVSIGHQKNTIGTGVHDVRPKRQRTRSSQTRASMKEYQ
jgi:hypothetical protein